MASSTAPRPAIATAASVDLHGADLLAEERSEDDGMPEHADKAADPVGWAARRGGSPSGALG